MNEINRFSALVAGVPLHRGSPVHIEEDELAFCELHGDQVKAIHTPREIFPRVHEYMHACHSDENWMLVNYAGCDFAVIQLAEDCRIHANHWPWQVGDTPEVIEASTKDWLRRELTSLNKAVAKGEKVSDFTNFAVRLRQAAVRMGSGVGSHWSRSSVLKKAGFVRGTPFFDLASQLLGMFLDGEAGKAAAIIQMTFFGPPKADERRQSPDGNDEATGKKITPYQGYVKQPKMEIIELPHSVRVKGAEIGYRRTAMGPRLHLPSLIKPVLPQRLFIKRAPQKPGGTILIDASGSMGSFDVVSQWVERAPFGTVAYYAGGSHAGKLFVYARNGLRSEEMPAPGMGGNTVDGPAMDWLLTQRPPYIFVTDEGFCGAEDSYAQIARLQVLKSQGIIKVVDYAHDETPDEE